MPSISKVSCTCSELLLLKLDTEKAGRSAVLRMAQTYGGRVLDIGEKTVTLEMTGRPGQVDHFLAQLEGFGIVEMARTGITALERGDGTIHTGDI